MSDQPDLLGHVSRHTVELTALRFWVRQLYLDRWRHIPSAGAADVQRRLETVKRTRAPLPDIDAATQNELLDVMMREIEQLGGEIVGDLKEAPASLGPYALPDGAVDMGALLDVLDHMARTAQAQERWIAEVFHLVSNGRPGRMADLIRAKMHAMKSDPPSGPSHLSPAELDALMCEELPCILAVGENLANTLKSTQDLIDRRRAEASSGNS